MENSNSLGGARIALLIDFDNVILGIDDPGFDIELVVNALRERGTITVSRVYGDWYRHSRHRRRLMEHGVELVEAPAFGPVIKNSADIKIALDGYEIGMTMPHINTFCLVSGDSDFLPLIKKLQSLGKNVLVICGNRFTSDMLRRNCNEFISYENLLAASYGAAEDATTLEGAFALLHRAMEALRERGSEIRTSTLKQMMIQLNPVFSEKTFGYNQFRGFLDKAARENLIKLGPRDRVSGEFYVLLPEEDEADVIENIERAEPAEVVEEIVESRRGNRGRGNRRDERSDEETNERGNRGRNNRRETFAPADEEPQRQSRREARLQALRQQEDLEQQTPASAEPNAAPLATPLTPATDFSPANETEVREKSIARAELLSRGMRVGKVKFSGKTGRAEAVETAVIAAEAPVVEAPVVEANEITPADATSVEAEMPATEEVVEEVVEVAEKPKRSRSRRRKKTPESEEIAAETAKDETSMDETAKDETKAEEATPAAETPAVEATEEAETPTEAPAEEAKAQEKRPRRRRTSRKTTEETPAEEVASAEAATPDADAQVVAPAEEAAEEKKPRRRRTSRKKAEETESAVQPDDAELPIATESPNETSAETPDEAKPKTRRRRTSRKKAEDAEA